MSADLASTLLLVGNFVVPAAVGFATSRRRHRWLIGVGGVVAAALALCAGIGESRRGSELQGGHLVLFEAFFALFIFSIWSLGALSGRAARLVVDRFLPRDKT